MLVSRQNPIAINLSVVPCLRNSVLLKGLLIHWLKQTTSFEDQ
ncbi:hypothetical protein EV13_2889 [Prochlorococcus sp. MIT 0702]|nr:hypothetical protein EV12_2835 [Prochlorococcus sp. MIT 0701]KGG26109.1 hypothetical protein EV13_2889 [Prochlorococcus sp. MIT 0702]KGG30718.1 hypothetical protein EV14_2650 [Prochlorococcus sp. MIT 0703]